MPYLFFSIAETGEEVIVLCLHQSQCGHTVTTLCVRFHFAAYKICLWHSFVKCIAVVQFLRILPSNDLVNFVHCCSNWRYFTNELVSSDICQVGSLLFLRSISGQNFKGLDCGMFFDVYMKSSFMIFVDAGRRMLQM